MWKIYICVVSLLRTNRTWRCLSISLIILSSGALYICDLSFLSFLFCSSFSQTTAPYIISHGTILSLCLSFQNLDCIGDIWSLYVCVDSYGKFVFISDSKGLGRDVCLQHFYGIIISLKNRFRSYFTPKNQRKRNIQNCFKHHKPVFKPFCLAQLAFTYV